ncbi:hypothetical protein ACT8ZV_19515 [Nocardioides sp. MAHUQ-72]|uniref:hypothetical protein n=1 Tax=unclassified Nocardioides TaxID=2615069 RepID=UPI0036233D5B
MPAPPLPSPHPVATRRAALGATVGGALVGLGALTGCDADRDPAGPRPGVSTGAAATEGPDAALVADLVELLGSLSVLTGHVETTYPRLAPTVRPFRELHAAHLRALGEEPPDSFAHGGRFAGPEAALREVRVREERAQRRLVDAAAAARSGTLARLVACMSAGAAQHLAQLPGASTTTGGEVSG